jgi:hypothetical protein
VQLNEQEPSLYDKSHQDYARQDKIDFVWERNSEKMKESGMYVLSNLKLILESKYKVSLLKQHKLILCDLCCLVQVSM